LRNHKFVTENPR